MKYFFVLFCLCYNSLCFLAATNSENTENASKIGRKLVFDTDYRHECFDVNYNFGYADYLLNPLKANGNRGDWGDALASY